MSGVLIDSNILIDIFTKDVHWARWSAEQLEHYSKAHRLIINQIIFAEISARFSHTEELDAVLDNAKIIKEELPWDAAFIAAKVHMAYRKQGGDRASTLPDFFIGAHALLADYMLLTRDAKRYQSYFPKVKLLCP